MPDIGPKVILAATDLLDASRHVVPRAAQLARDAGGQLVVIHVLSGDGASGAHEPAKRQAHELLDRALAAAGADDDAPEPLVAEGVPGAAVEAAAERIGAELVVLGFHRETVSGTTRLGSTMTYLLVRTDSDVLMVRSEERGPYRAAVIAWDGEKDLKPALEKTRAIAPEADCAFYFSVPAAQDVPDGEERLRTALKDAGIAPADVSLHVSSDGLLAGLREVLEEEGAELLVLPTRGNQRGDLGYVASEILAQRICDTLCLHQAV